MEDPTLTAIPFRRPKEQKDRNANKDQPQYEGFFFTDAVSRNDRTSEYSRGAATGPIETVWIEGRKVAKIIELPTRRLLGHWRKKFGPLRMISSGWRSNAEQYELFEALVEGRRKELVALPGWSNHQNGYALDLNVINSKETKKTFLEGKDTIYWQDTEQYRWLVKNAPPLGFIRTVPSESWHWEYRPDRKRPFSLLPPEESD